MKKIVYIIMLLCLSVNVYSQLESGEWSYSQLPSEEFALIVNDIEIRFGTETKKIFELFGEAEYTLFKNGWKIQREYVYPWGKVYTSDVDDSIVFGVKSESELVKTKKGIQVGSSKEDVISAYGKEYYSTENSIYYLNREYDTLQIEFFFNEKVVGEINDDKLRVRKEPRIGEVLGHVNKGDRVIILGKSENKDTIDNFNDYWYKIMFDGIEGWVYGGYVDIEEEKVSLLSIFMGT